MVFSATPQPEFRFAEADNNWDLSRLYDELATAKKQYDPKARPGLTDIEKEYLRGFLCGYDPVHIAKICHKDVKGVKSTISNTLYRYVEILTGHPEHSINDWRDICMWLEEAGYKKPSKIWDGSPDISIFYGQENELQELKNLIIDQQCRLINLYGIGGSGKTYLSVKLAQEIQCNFKYVIWRSLRYAPTFKEVINELLQIFLPQVESNLIDNIGQGISQLIKYLNKYNCLLVLDAVENLLLPGELAGKYKPEHEAYKDLIQRLGEEPSKSCLILTSREKLKEIAVVETKTPYSPIRSFKVKGLNKEAAKKILQDKGLPESSDLQKIIDFYRGNPLALKLTATIIQELYGGHIGDFLKNSSAFIGDFQEILNQHFKFLSELEKEILYFIALEQKPVMLSIIQNSFGLNLFSKEDIALAIQSLILRSFLEKVFEGEVVYFYLQPVVMKYITNKLIEQICKEIIMTIKNQKIETNSLLRNQLLLQFQSPHKQGIKELNYSFIVSSIKEKMRNVLKARQLGNAEEKLKEVMAVVPKPCFIEEDDRQNT
ncbi:NACHT domain-containing protein [Anabaena sphaerica FACHB-251]|uniref:NACHT domain-containing protein n=1 Tax=Anabaena sphaerica FACHB-251 TaxID=2692883 RepID=A0A926WLN7_9NOST|nr:NB-ARC domain-containing protein [Anabaena sphaerica]MBD2296941.1 NACHT domain-containing protein [Anabaena sphaerica FACHB-251]